MSKQLREARLGRSHVIQDRSNDLSPLEPLARLARVPPVTRVETAAVEIVRLSDSRKNSAKPIRNFLGAQPRAMSHADAMINCWCRRIGVDQCADSVERDPTGTSSVETLRAHEWALF